ncbi:UPF0481 protein At3g47200 [Cajanus cajan]|uniref:UPF0481 protein At3g47200 family n=1 Tax=Cajanus cajan TaxID=3821 RepID=A0A151TRG5_CAJCA|nr:UPF0481 protein At3g47200 [Cajanus cajan]KYP69576.1 UPF0481 protein At3g47200 family [Cajanus cajan]
MSGTSNLKERLSQLEAYQRPQQPCVPKIQRVAQHLRDREHLKKHYSPKLVSLGPIHHGDPKLELGEQYKHMWASTYVRDNNTTPQALYSKVAVAANVEELKGMFGDDLFSNDPRGFASVDEMISWMLFVDGCALLQILGNADLSKPNKLNVKVDQLVLVMMDVLLLENQLPYELLKLLWVRDQEESSLIQMMKHFLKCHHWATEKDHNKTKLKGLTLNMPLVHLLNLQRTIILHDPQDNQKKQNQNNDPNQNTGESEMVTYRNIKELRAAGIGVKSSRTRRPSDISFSKGFLRSELTLPEIVVDDTTANTMLNLIAYEMCPDFENDYGICSYVSFLDSLIDHPDDVKVLRSEGILLNSLGSDEEVAELFNIIGTDLVPDMTKYARTRTQIEKHYKNKWKTWFTLGCHNYFGNPWSIIAFHAAVLGLALTFIQTWYAIHP